MATEPEPSAEQAFERVEEGEDTRAEIPAVRAEMPADLKLAEPASHELALEAHVREASEAHADEHTFDEVARSLRAMSMTMSLNIEARRFAEAERVTAAEAERVAEADRLQQRQSSEAPDVFVHICPTPFFHTLPSLTPNEAQQIMSLQRKTQFPQIMKHQRAVDGR